MARLTDVLYRQTEKGWFMYTFHDNSKKPSSNSGPFKNLEKMLIDQFNVPLGKRTWIMIKGKKKVPFIIPDLFLQTGGDPPFKMHKERLDFIKKPYKFFTKETFKLHYNKKSKSHLFEDGELNRRKPTNVETPSDTIKEVVKDIVKTPSTKKSTKYDYPEDCITSQDKKNYRRLMRKKNVT